MELIDRQIAELEKTDVAPTKRADFDAFWEDAVGRARTAPLHVRGGRIDYPVDSIEVRDVTYEGLDGTAVRAWVLLPAEARQGPVPAVVSYHGAGGSRGVPSDFAHWLLMGVAVVAHDFRMQSGLTGSNTGFAGSRTPGWFNMGILNRETFYYYHAWLDCLRALELALQTPEIDGGRVGVIGGSQGGGAALAMAALHPAPALCVADVPSNCWLEKRLMDRAGGMASAADFMRIHPESLGQVCETLSYFDNINLAERITCPVLVSVGLKDPVCPPPNVYAAYNKIRAPKEIAVYPFGEHDGGGATQRERQMAFVREHLFR